MSERGVFAVDRGIWSDPDFADETFTEREAWMWMISGAAWKPISVGFQGRVLPIERAEFCYSLRFLAEKFGWKKSRVERFLNRLVKRDMLSDTVRDAARIYKIKNYNRFQRAGMPKRDAGQDANRDTNRDGVGTGSGRGRDKEETLKHSNKEERVIARAAGAFPAWYELYPRKVGKLAAEKAYHSALKRKDATPELLLAGLKLYVASPECENPKFIQYPATWLNAGRWLDVPEPVPRSNSLGFTDSPAEEIPDAA